MFALLKRRNEPKKPNKMNNLTDLTTKELTTFETLIKLGDDANLAYTTVINNRESEAKKQAQLNNITQIEA